MRDKYNIRFNVAALFESLGGVSGTAAMLKAAGLNVSARTLQKQKEREAIPSDAVASIIYAAGIHGKTIDLREFLLEREEDADETE